MDWKNYRARDQGECHIHVNGYRGSATFEMGIIDTGRQRVFAGHFVRLTMINGHQIIGEDEHSLRRALRHLAKILTPLGLVLDCAALHPAFSESGLSMNTGWGYWRQDSQPIHMMDPPPTARDRDDIAEIISEAVEGMRIGVNIKRPQVPAPHDHEALRKAGLGRAEPL